MKTGQKKWMSIQARHVPDHIRVLRDLNMPAVRIAELLRAKPDNVRQIDRRARKRQSPRPIIPRPWIRDQRRQFSDSSEAEWEYLRNLDVPRRRSADVDQLGDLLRTIATIRSESRARDLLKGFRSLRKLIPRVAAAQYGCALNSHMLLYEELARFALLAGRLEEAFECALVDLANAKAAIIDTLAQNTFIKRYCKAADLASATLQNQRRFGEALFYARESYWAWRPLGPYERCRRRSRQFGAKLLRMSSGPQGKRVGEFVIAIDRLKADHTAADETRLQASWTYAVNLLRLVPINFGRGSVQHVIAVNALAAAGMMAGRDQEAIEILSTIDPDPNEMRYQSTLTWLLHITPELGLEPHKLEYWIKFMCCDLPFHGPSPIPEAA